MCTFSLLSAFLTHIQVCAVRVTTRICFEKVGGICVIVRKPFVNEVCKRLNETLLRWQNEEIQNVQSFLEVVFKMWKRKTLIISTLFNDRLFKTLWFKRMKQLVGLLLLQHSLPEIQPAAVEALLQDKQWQWHLLGCRLFSGSSVVISSRHWCCW